MLLNSFLHLSGVSSTLEKYLWNLGILTWDSLESNLPTLREKMDPSFFPQELSEEISRSRMAIRNRDWRFFWDRIPYSEAWRIFGEFPEIFLCLDIETTGIGYPFVVTCICIFDGKEVFQFTRTRNLEEFESFWSDKEDRIILTYNGFRFDLPFLKRAIGWAPKNKHIDLMHLLHAIGIKGGLKGSEIQLGISRPEDLKGMDGNQAVHLWNQYVETDISDYLDLLIKYNQADTINLYKILEIIYDQKKRKMEDEIRHLFPVLNFP
jgi:uncharacterized protein YprB with RNaseH-like and TPR domain